MIVECENCHTRYNVDENKVPAAGVKVRCRECKHVLFIKREPEPPSEPEVVVEREPARERPFEPEQPVGQDVEQPTRPTEPPQEPEKEIETPTPEIPEPPTPVPPDAVVTHPPETEVPVEQAPEVKAPPEITSEEEHKMHDRARRLAKALASDLVLYNKEKVEAGLRDGTLVKLLGSEIRRSWEYYCQQVPKYIVESTDYFREQLNKIVGKGKEIFK